MTTAGSGSDAGMWATGGFTHRLDMLWDGDGGTDPLIGMATANPETVGLGGYFLPLSETGTVDRVVCGTCHLVHGASRQAVGTPIRCTILPVLSGRSQPAILHYCVSTTGVFARYVIRSSGRG